MERFRKYAGEKWSGKNGCSWSWQVMEFFFWGGAGGRVRSRRRSMRGAVRRMRLEVDVNCTGTSNLITE